MGYPVRKNEGEDVWATHPSPTHRLQADLHRRPNDVMFASISIISEELMADKPDPFDVEALESAVNDSATRVSAIWISFLVFSLYLLIAATTVTQRQLLLAQPITLPVLNIALPLWGFFFLAPILFVILHVYTLLQVLLLRRAASAYNDAVARLELSPEENISLRQRLANTLFAQIFAGSPREREGIIGWLLRTIVWITLAIAPILVVLAFQLSFLAYHSHIATWTHRLLILVEIAVFFLIWQLVLDAQKNFQWPKVIPLQLLGSKEKRHDAWLWLREHAIPLIACIFLPTCPFVTSDVSRRAACQSLCGQSIGIGALRAMAATAAFQSDRPSI